jgi:hypothetical protein
MAISADQLALFYLLLDHFQRDALGYQSSYIGHLDASHMVKVQNEMRKTYLAINTRLHVLLLNNIFLQFFFMTTLSIAHLRILSFLGAFYQYLLTMTFVVPLGLIFAWTCSLDSHRLLVYRIRVLISL